MTTRKTDPAASGAPYLAWVAEIARTAHALPEIDRPGYLQRAVEETGGTWTEQACAPGGEPHLQLSLGGFTGFGATRVECAADWIKAVHRVGEDALWYARAVLADVTHFDDRTIRDACTLIEAQSPDPEERARASDLRILIEGEAA